MRSISGFAVAALAVLPAACTGNATARPVRGVGGGGGAGSEILPPDRLTVWNPGVAGGIPARASCANIDAATYGDGAQDATAGIQAAVDACPTGRAVELSAGTFSVGDGGRLIRIGKGITLRGAGADRTTLQKLSGAKPGQEAT